MFLIELKKLTPELCTDRLVFVSPVRKTKISTLKLIGKCFITFEIISHYFGISKLNFMRITTNKMISNKRCLVERDYLPF